MDIPAQLDLRSTFGPVFAEIGEGAQQRERNYSHANAARVRDDPQVLARIGEASATVYAAEAAALRVADAVQAVADLAGVADEGPERVAAANERTTP